MPVYFIQDGPGGAIKIGVTAGSPQVRLSALQTGNPRRLELLASIPGSSCEEAALHERFAALRIQGEWFRADDRLLGFIDGLRYLSANDDTVVREWDMYGLSSEQTMVMLGIADAANVIHRVRAALAIAESANGLMTPSELLAVDDAKEELARVIEQRRSPTSAHGAGLGVASFMFGDDTIDVLATAIDQHHSAMADIRLAESWCQGIDLSPDCGDLECHPPPSGWGTQDTDWVADDVPADEVF